MLHQTITAQVAPWHASPIAKQLIADMFALEDMAYRYRQFAREAGEKYPECDETASAVGEFGQSWKRPRTFTASGLIGKMFDRLTGERDNWIEGEVFRLGAERGMSRAHDAGQAVHDAWDDLWEEVTGAADTVDRAIDLAIVAINERVS